MPPTPPHIRQRKVPSTQVIHLIASVCLADRQYCPMQRVTKTMLLPLNGVPRSGAAQHGGGGNPSCTRSDTFSSNLDTAACYDYSYPTRNATLGALTHTDETILKPQLTIQSPAFLTLLTHHIPWCGAGEVLVACVHFVKSVKVAGVARTGLLAHDVQAEYVFVFPTSIGI